MTVKPVPIPVTETTIIDNPSYPGAKIIITPDYVEHTGVGMTSKYKRGSLHYASLVAKYRAEADCIPPKRTQLHWYRATTAILYGIDHRLRELTIKYSPATSKLYGKRTNYFTTPPSIAPSPWADIVCDRCHKGIDGERLDGGTVGFYEGESWRKYMDKDEEIICDACMFDDSRYQEDYPHIVGSNETG